MNPFCPYHTDIPTMLLSKIRKWFDKDASKYHAGKHWECSHCHRLWKKGHGNIRRGTEVRAPITVKGLLT